MTFFTLLVLIFNNPLIFLINVVMTEYPFVQNGIPKYEKSNDVRLTLDFDGIHTNGCALYE